MGERKDGVKNREGRKRGNSDKGMKKEGTVEGRMERVKEGSTDERTNKRRGKEGRQDRKEVMKV